MKLLAQNASWALYSDFGRTISEGTVRGKASAAGPMLTFKVVDKLQEYDYVNIYVEATASSLHQGQGAFWNHYAAKKGGDVSVFESAGGIVSFNQSWSTGTWSFSVNADNVPEHDLQLRVWLGVSNSPNLLETTIKILDDDVSRGTSKADTLVGTRKADWINGFAGNDKISGGAGNDSLYGGSGNDRLSGGSGKDELWGGKGNDTLLGDSGDDLLRGEAGKDRLEGSKGNDTLIGGSSNDVLFGGSGKDTFVFYEKNGKDTIKDFKPNADKIQFITDSWADFEDLNIRQSGANTVVRFEATTVILEGVKAKSLDFKDFVFTDTWDDPYVPQDW